MAVENIALNVALATVRFFGPTILLIIVLSLFAKARKPTTTADGKSNGHAHVPSSSSPILDLVVPVKSPRRTAILTILILVAIAYLLDGTVVVLRAVLWKQWEGAEGLWKGIEQADVLGLMTFGALVITGTWKDAEGQSVWMSRRVKAFALVALVYTFAEVILLGVAFPTAPKGPPVHIPENPPPPGVTLAPLLHFGLAAFRLLVIIPLFPILSRPITTYERSEHSTDVNGAATAGESSNLLVAPTARYGTFLPPPSTAPSLHSGTPGPTDPEFENGKPKPLKEKEVTEPSWRDSMNRVRRLFPYLWPHKSIWLQFLASLCMLLLVVGRFINFLLPFTLRELVDELDTGARGGLPLGLVLSYCALRFLQGSGGLGALREVLWAPVMQYSDREMSQLCFDHLLNLSLAFHTRRKTGEVMRILDRGAALNNMFQLLLFNILPTLADIVIAMGAFIYFFGWDLCLVIGLVLLSYVVASITLTRWRTKLRREMRDRDVVTRGIHTDALLNYETIKYFVGEEHEGQRYRQAIMGYQLYEYKVIASLNLLNFVQNIIITTGLLVGSLIVARRVVQSTSGVGDFVFFITYLALLYGPLNMLGTIYRSINQSLVDAERLLDLLNEPTEVKDIPGAPDLVVKDGVIVFENVSFSYDGKTTALNNVSFTVPKGHSVALVGESGGGKSTLLRLLFRQYDLKEGRILIDGQDIRDVTQASLRKAIGVVPQDSVLFNASIAYNIGYGKFGSTQEEINVAAVAARMHDRILSFPDGYETKVGERGVRLSGGEKQRVAIARTFLKNSPILALDEATSALDTATEKDIQKALQNLLHGRTSISIAHRLSTIASADIILVLKDGQIVESGTHEELLAQGGEFAAMWAKQVTRDDQHTPTPGKSPSVPVGEVDGYKVADEVTAIAGETAPVPQVMPEEEPHLFLGPGPVITDLPPTEAELAANTSKQEAREAETIFVEDSPASIAQEIPAVSYAEVAAVEPSEPATSAVVTHAEVEPRSEHKLAPQDEPKQVIAFPTSTPGEASPAPTGSLAFPASKSDTSSQKQVPSVAPTPTSISFKPVENPPPRQTNGTQNGKEEDKETRPRRISQNFQRLARRISLGTRRSGSIASIPQAASPGSSNAGDVSREGSVDAGPSRASATPRAASPAVQAAAAADVQSPSESESVSTSTPKSKRKALMKKKPTRSKTTW